MTFNDLPILLGSNARFENCTRGHDLRGDDDRMHHQIGTTGALDRIEDDGNITYEEKFGGLEAPNPDGSSVIMNTKQWSNNIVPDGCSSSVRSWRRPGEYTYCDQRHMGPIRST